jgi:hypothetical protein
MKSTSLMTALAVLLLVGATPALAQKRGHAPLGQRGGFLVQTDADFGGETLATVYYDYDDYYDDDDYFTQKIRAGQGFALSVGGWLRPFENSALEIQASVGYKYESTYFTDSDVSFSRTLLQLEALYRWPNGFYVGAGLMRHMSPKLSGDDYYGDFKFDDENGLSLEAGWRWIGLHYTGMEYSMDQYDIEGIDGNSIGIRFTWRPGERWF